MRRTSSCLQNRIDTYAGEMRVYIAYRYGGGGLARTEYCSEHYGMVRHGLRSLETVFWPEATSFYTFRNALYWESCRSRQDVSLEYNIGGVRVKGSVGSMTHGSLPKFHRQEIVRNELWYHPFRRAMKLGHLCTPWGAITRSRWVSGRGFLWQTFMACQDESHELLISTGGGVVTDEKRTPCISIAQCCAPRGRNANPLRMDKARKLKLSGMID